MKINHAIHSTLMLTLIRFAIVALLFIGFSCQKQKTGSDSSSNETMLVTEQNICASDDILMRDIASNPKRALFLSELEEKTQLYESRSGFQERSPGILYLPIVIHIVHVDPSIVSDAQILSQLQVWNKDFNKQNSELANPSVYLAGYDKNKVANCQIQFYITNIVRVQTTVVEFPLNNTVKSSANGGSDPVDPATKLNVWVCNTPNGSSWGQGPGVNPLVDGIIIDYAFFGTSNPYYAGRVGTHEVGHWLNLWHIWGNAQCGDDQVKDTPKHFGPSSGCPAVGTKSTCSGRPLLMWMNYMDYTIGTCQYMFTAGQKARMDATIDFARPAYFSTLKRYVDIFP